MTRVAATSAVPRGSTKPDREVEPGIVIRHRARYLHSAEQARAHIAGWDIVDERAFRLEGASTDESLRHHRAR